MLEVKCYLQVTGKKKDNNKKKKKKKVVSSIAFMSRRVWSRSPRMLPSWMAREPNIASSHQICRQSCSALENISHKVTPNDHTSDLVENIHLMGRISCPWIRNFLEWV